MILVDDRIGSKELAKPLTAAGIDVLVTRLEFADVAFEGKGAKGSLVEIGVERKTIGDLISSLRSGRLAGHQLPGLLKTYTHNFLVIEGQWRHNENGQVTTYQGPRRGWKVAPGKMSASELEKRVLTLELCGGLHARYTNGLSDTIRYICNLFHFWTDRAFDSHKSHLQVHEAPTIQPISDYRALYMRLPGVGISLSLAVENHFKGGPRQAWCAGVDEWAAITSGEKKIGHKKASQIVSFCRGGL